MEWNVIFDIIHYTVGSHIMNIYEYSANTMVNDSKFTATIWQMAYV